MSRLPQCDLKSTETLEDAFYNSPLEVLWRKVAKHMLRALDTRGKLAMLGKC